MFKIKLIGTILSAILMGMLLSFTVNLFKSKLQYVRTVTKVLLIGIFVIPIYLVFCFQENVVSATFLNSLYYICVDWMVFLNLKFIFEFTRKSEKFRKILPALGTVVVSDNIFLLLNNFFHHSFVLTKAYTDFGLMFWSRTMFPLQYFHFLICYFMSLSGCILLLAEIIRSPFYYKPKYLSILLTYLAIIVTNFVSNVTNFPIDLSIFLYGIFAAYISWSSAYRVPNSMILQILQQANNVMTDGILYFNTDNECIYLNEYIRCLFSKTPDFSFEHASGLLEKRIGLLRPENSNHLYWRKKLSIDGETRNFFFEYEKLFFLKTFIGSFVKVTDTTEYDRIIYNQHYISTHDSLTGIYNRERFFEVCNKIIKENPDDERYMVVSNIKNFKLVNEIFGRNTGDQILKMEAELISKNLNYDIKNVYGRISEDKFAAFVPKVFFKPESFEKSLISLGRIIKTSNYTLRVVLGLAETHGFFETAQMLYDQGLLALKSMPADSKTSYVFYNSELMEKILTEKNIVTDFPDAIRMEEFKLYLQPVFDRKSRCIGAEAFVHWKNQALGQEEAQKFLGVLEEHSLIHVLDAYVLEKAIKLLKFWNENGQGDKIISVNISTNDIYPMNIYELVTGLLKKYGVKPERLYLEFKETLLTAVSQNGKKLLSDLQKFGVRVGIDNFGRGYSSLNLLKDVKADFFKIDMLFLSESENEERSFKILKFMVSLAKTLNMRVISQGIEQKSQCEMLKELGCDYMQGFYFSKPMPITEFEKTYMS